ncbi:PREDICTED: trans-1,2-dihydrobenzene-1,2-diol dehydrogenase-like [Nicrophorus vespilloides]|uniref:Trans-1,2-dihydrobenzene-1,2-diol dehydrogenase n=1 Tax=Nicrophorus vespilloides TaxID=110193 RepID=A0ABM1MHI5_NICVS|nr:PREDICTED: trans-1,2-dihydrobenzene-1,2-diol dehydrogenase-like [Nicrophorus vespilloides]
MALRWGIASAGKISNDFVCALQTLPDKNHEVVAVAARSLETAKVFSEKLNIPQAIEGYESLAKCENIDIVYVGVINTGHFEVSKMMLQHGKHVLCEKPLTLNRKQSQELVAFAKEKKLFLMEAVWSRCFPIYKKLRETLDSGIIGDVKYVNACFGFPIAEVPRLNTKELGGGTILDLGVYTLQFCQFVFKGLKPTKFLGSGYLNVNNVDESANAIIQYPGKATAVISTTSVATFSNEATIIGTKGAIKIPMFWCPTKMEINDETFEFELPKSQAEFNFFHSTGLSYEAEECRRCIKDGLLESPHMSHEESLGLSELMDMWRKNVGVVFEQDL